MFRERRRKCLVWLCLLATVAHSTLTSPVLFGGWPSGFRRKPTQVQTLASKIDKLQRHLDDYGTVVAKDPDVWGQSRLMTHRMDFETEMKKKLDDFQFRLNAAEFTRDSAFLASALSLQAALSGEQVGTIPPAVGSSASQQTIIANVPTGAQLNANDSALVPRSGFSTGFSRIQGSDGAAFGVGIEPTIELDQLKRYLDHLNEIRRLNEGDDTADSPGYALHLVRIPVSVLPGKHTHKGHGAEITMTIRPHLGEELLPNAFRDFVINGVRDRITPVVLHIADRGPMSKIREQFDRYYGWKKFENGKGGEEEDINSKLQYRLMDLMQNPTREGGPSDEPNRGFQIEVSEFAPQSSMSRNGRLSIPPSQMNMVDGVTLYRVALDVFDTLAVSAEPRQPENDPPAGERGLHYTDVEALLLRELDAAYDFLEQPNAQFLWDRFCTPQLAVAIREVRRGIPVSREARLGVTHEQKVPPFEEVQRQRKEFFESVEMAFREAKDSSTSNLAWHIIVESALVNEELVEDMKNLASNKNAWCVNVGWLPFYGPNPPHEARAAFNNYVQCRWPIHVFALDPVTQDQNVASGLSRRREMQMVLALAAAQRALTLQSLTQFIRRLEYDLETIDLNRTAVGFTHGNDTFGWRFYPRVQVPPVRSNIQAAVSDLIIGGPNRDDDISQRRLEPGMRECTAIVVMPSFVPNVVLDTRSSWFRLADHHGCVPPRFMRRKGDLRDAVDLSSEIVSLRRLACSCFEDECDYRPGELHRLKRAIDTLDRALPLQTAYVEMPYENLLGGSELFNSSILGLKPTLRSWYGAPGIVVSDRDDLSGSLHLRVGLQQRIRAAEQKLRELNDEKRMKVLDDPSFDTKTINDQITAVTTIRNEAQTELTAALSIPEVKTTLFLVGKNFSVLDTRVIAGGVAIPDDDVRLISRDVIQITVPSSVSPVKRDGRLFVDVHLATPYGPTPRLPIPVANDNTSAIAEAKKHADEAKKHADEAKKHAATAPPGFEWEKKSVNVIASYDPVTLVVSQLQPQPLQNAVVLNNSVAPFPQVGDIQFGFFLKVKYKDQDVADVKNGQHKRPFFFNANTVVQLPSGALRYELTSQLIGEVEQYLRSAGSGEVEQVEIDGYLRMREPDRNGHVDGLPIVHLDSLTLKVVKPPATTPSTPVPASPVSVSTRLLTPFSQPPAVAEPLLVPASPVPPPTWTARPGNRSVRRR